MFICNGEFFYIFFIVYLVAKVIVVLSFFSDRLLGQ